MMTREFRRVCPDCRGDSFYVNNSVKIYDSYGDEGTLVDVCERVLVCTGCGKRFQSFDCLVPADECVGDVNG